jgi:hypothetical protein
MKLKTNKPYILIYKIGDRLEIESGTAEEIKKKIERYDLDFNEYAIVEGKVIKSFSTVAKV